MEEKQYQIFTPWESLDDWQIEYIESPPNQDCFLLTGRQVGKTTAMSIKAVELCVNHYKKGERILIASITEKQGYHMLAKALAYAMAVYPNQIMKGKDKPTMHKIMFKNGTEILCYASGETGEGLRGLTIKKLMIDEGSRMSDEFFIAVKPMLSVIKGSMDIASTPCGKTGFFYECSKDDNFKKFYVNAEDCPRHTKEFLERERKSMSRLQYAQEYMAQFLDELRRVFTEEILKNCFKEAKDFNPNGDKKYLGVDVARYGGDANAFVIAENKENRIWITKADKTERVGINETFKKILELERENNFKKILVDDAGVGGGLTDFLIEQFRGKVIGINNSSRTIDHEKERTKKILKEDLYSNAILEMEKGNVEILQNNNLYVSLASMQFEYKENRLLIYGKDNHLSEAFVRALWGIKTKGLNLFIRSF